MIDRFISVRERAEAQLSLIPSAVGEVSFDNHLKFATIPHGVID